MFTPDFAVTMSEFAGAVILMSIALCFFTGILGLVLILATKGLIATDSTWLRRLHHVTRCSNAAFFAVLVGVMVQMLSWRDGESVGVVAFAMLASVGLSRALLWWDFRQPTVEQCSVPMPECPVTA